MNEKLESAQHKFIESIGKLCDSFGFNKFIAQLYALLYLSDRPMSLDELSEKLSASKGNVSLNIRELEKWGAVKNIWVKGSRKDYYEADTDIKKVFSNKIRTAVQKRIGEISGMVGEFNTIVDSASAELTEEERKIAALYRERMKKIEDMKSLASTALSLMEKIL
ncbi:MAG: hypothetical protein PHS46_03305 [Candidatus Omnitrophica bacterium]|nr:hypothetical protein [Candidatus Omnitrophota bacterium]